MLQFDWIHFVSLYGLYTLDISRDKVYQALSCLAILQATETWAEASEQSYSYIEQLYYHSILTIHLPFSHTTLSLKRGGGLYSNINFG